MFSNLYRCVVEDNKDPKHLARVKMRVIGVHDKRLELVAVEDLPWSDVLNPIDAGNTLGSSTNVLIGTWGYCVPLNESLTEFLFIGTIKGGFAEKPPIADEDGNEIGFRDPSGTFPQRLNEPDNNLTYGKLQANDITQPRVQVDEFIEPNDTAQNAVYPSNKVYEDANGNIMEVDGTPTNPRFRFQHASGARIEINVDGDITLQSSPKGNIYQDTTGLFAVGADGNLIIDCDVKITGSLECGGEVADLEGNLSSLRSQHDINVGIWNSHTHTYVTSSLTPVLTTAPTNPVNTPIIEEVDPRLRFVWVGKPN